MVNLEKHRDKFTRKDELRKWTSAGGHTTEAIIAAHESGQVRLMNTDGKSTAVDLSKLSDDDRAYVRKWIADQTKLVKQARRRR